MKNKVWLVGDLYLDKSPWKDIKEGTSDASREEEFFIQYNDLVADDDAVVFFGNIAVSDVAYWMGRISNLAGNKVLLLGDQDKNRPKWYSKFGFKMVVPFNESLIFDAENYGKVLLSHLPAYAAVGYRVERKYHGLMNKHGRTFENSGCILNVHGHTLGTGEETHRTYDVNNSYPVVRIPSLDQVLAAKFRR